MQNSVRNRFLLFLTLSLFVVSCRPSQDKLTQMRIRDLSEMAELGTVEYTVKKIVKADDFVWWKYGKRKIIFTCKAFIKAGIDMKEFSPGNVKADPESKTVSIVLPKARILSFNMPPEDIFQDFSLITGLRAAFSPEEKQELLVLGEKDIRSDIPNMGILEDAEANARLFFTAMFSQIGYETVDVTFE
ncbi:MAG: DUF4230 domain-containing protein [Bacteroidales bacterium]|nr:DUF4230 domain-containing protein [Bacteroidales bacterium]